MMEELEADKIHNVPHPRKNKTIYGHNSAKNLFLKHKKDVIHIIDKSVFTDIDTVDDLKSIT